MGKIWNLTAARFLKDRGQVFSFGSMILIAAMLLNLGLVTWRNYDGNFDRRAKQLNSADVIFAVQETDETWLDGFLTELSEDGQAKGMERRPALMLPGRCEYAENEFARNYVMLNASDAQTIGRVAYVEKMQETVERPVYLPYLFHTGGGYETGDSFTLTVSLAGREEESFTYTVAGFFEETFLATIYTSTIGLILDEGGYEELSEHFGGRQDGSLFFVQLQEGTDGEAFCARHQPQLSGDDRLYDSVFYEAVKSARTVTSSMGALMIVAFSLIVVVIGLIVVHFWIKNSIEEELTNIGALKAIGYTGGVLTASIWLQFLVIGIAGTVPGILCSYLILPLASRMFAVQTGIVWKQGFDIVCAAWTFLFVQAAISLVSVFSSKKARRLSVLAALRSGMLTHSFRKNPLPLDQSRGSLSLLLSAKSLLQNGRQNLLTGLIVAAISFAAVFAGAMYDNIVRDFDSFARLTAGEMWDASVTCADAESAAKLLEKIREMPEVRKAFFFLNDPVYTAQDQELQCYVTDQFGDYEYQDLIFAGRFPEYENETAIGGLMAKELGVEVGDEIVLKKDGREAQYLITGLLSSSNYLGRDAALTQDGYRILVPQYRPAYIAVYLQDSRIFGKTAEGEDEPVYGHFMEEMKKHSGQAADVQNHKKEIEAAMGIYREIVGILVIVITLVTAGVIALTLHLVIRQMLVRKRQELGIYKAIGFTTGQLVLQTAWSFFPVLLSGAALGCVLGKIAVNPLLSLLFSDIGIMRVNFHISLSLMAGLCMTVTLFGFGFSALASMRIKRIQPYDLLRE